VRFRGIISVYGGTLNSNHRVNVVRINELRKHPNADSLSLVDIDGYQVVVRTDEFRLGAQYIYVQPDSVVPATEPFKFLWADREFAGEVPMKYRRITVRRFRKEYSEGLLLPLSEFTGGLVHDERFKYGWIKDGDDVAAGLGIEHYEEPEPSMSTENTKRKLTLWQRILKFFGFGPKPFGPKGIVKYDVESLKNYPRVFVEGEPVIVTEKIHGSNARYYFDGKTFWAGSHNCWRKHDGSNVWSKAAHKYPWIEEFCRSWPKFVLFGEITPTQGGYAYGFETEVQFFAFDVLRPDGSYIGKQNLYKLSEIQRLVPVVYEGPYNAEQMKALAEGKSLVNGAKNIREGIVISSVEERIVRGVGRAQLKLKSLKFLEKENS
jgi:RNA ligase (TIGR02306 family)